MNNRQLTALLVYTAAAGALLALFCVAVWEQGPWALLVGGSVLVMVEALAALWWIAGRP